MIHHYGIWCKKQGGDLKKKMLDLRFNGEALDSTSRAAMVFSKPRANIYSTLPDIGRLDIVAEVEEEGTKTRPNI